MPKHTDPAADRAAMRREVQREQSLNAILDQIIDAENTRNQASSTILNLWNQVRREGFDVDAARRTHVQRIISRR